MKKKKIKSKKFVATKVAVEFYLNVAQKNALTNKAKRMGISRSELIKSTLKGSHLI